MKLIDVTFKTILTVAIVPFCGVVIGAAAGMLMAKVIFKGIWTEGHADKTMAYLAKMKEAVASVK